MLLYIARHAQSLGNAGEEKGPDPELTGHGLECSRRLGERLAITKFDAIIASPLLRAMQTAYEVVIRQPDGSLMLEPLHDLMETGIPPEYQGLGSDELIKKFPRMTRFPGERTPADGPLCLGEEDASAVMSRAYRVMRYLRARFPGDEDKVLLVTHATFMTRLISAALGLTHPQGFSFSHDNAGLTLIKIKPERIKLAFSNDTTHLYDENGEIDSMRYYPRI